MYFHGISIGGTDSALGRVAWLLFGLLLAVLGGSVVSNAIYWRIHALRVQGEIIGVRSRQRLNAALPAVDRDARKSPAHSSVASSSGARQRCLAKPRNQVRVRYCRPWEQCTY